MINEGNNVEEEIEKGPVSVYDDQVLVKYPSEKKAKLQAIARKQQLVFSEFIRRIFDEVIDKSAA